MAMENIELNSSRAPAAVGAYPHARKVGNMLYLSGVGPRVKDLDHIPGVELDTDNNIISYDFKSQCLAVFQNIEFILEDCGSSLDKVVDITVFLTDMKNDFPVFNLLYKDWVGHIRPCRTTLEINKLPTPIAIELKVMALID
ncbi:MAG: RidA family protein [Candidatus Kariarchaeum pelagius]|jgi:2-aminomuconate deaminase